MGIQLKDAARNSNLLSNNSGAHAQSHILFHSFHFMHIVFAATGTMITYLRYSKKLLFGFLPGVGTNVMVWADRMHGSCLLVMRLYNVSMIPRCKKYSDE